MIRMFTERILTFAIGLVLIATLQVDTGILGSKSDNVCQKSWERPALTSRADLELMRLASQARRKVTLEGDVYRTINVGQSWQTTFGRSPLAAHGLGESVPRNLVELVASYALSAAQRFRRGINMSG